MAPTKKFLETALEAHRRKIIKTMEEEFKAGRRVYDFPIAEMFQVETTEEIFRRVCILSKLIAETKKHLVCLLLWEHKPTCTVPLRSRHCWSNCRPSVLRVGGW